MPMPMPTGGRGAAAAVAAVAVALAVVAALWLRPAPADQATLIAPQDAWRQARAGELVIVDVRSPGEWRETGVPAGALTVTVHRPGGLPGFAAALAEALDGARDTPIAVICASGVRSSRARDYLAAHGFGRVDDISAGMLGRPGASGWLDRGLPTEPCGC